MVKTLKNLPNQESDGLQTWLEALMTSFTKFVYMLTLTYFMAWSNLVACAFEWGKLLESHLMGKNLQEMTKLTIFMFMKNFEPRRLSAPAAGAMYMNMAIMFKHL